VVARVRPLLPTEHKHPISLKTVPYDSPEPAAKSAKQKLVLMGGPGQKSLSQDKVFTFEKVLGETTTQPEVFGACRGE